MKKQSAPVLDTTLVGISGIKGLPALAATAPQDLPLAIFKRKLMLLDLLLQRIILSDNPKFVVSYIKLLDELEVYVRGCNERAGVPVPKYVRKPAAPKKASRQKPPAPRQSASKPGRIPEPARAQPTSKPTSPPKVEAKRMGTATALPEKPRTVPPDTLILLEEFPESPGADFPARDVANLLANLRKIQAAYAVSPTP